MSALNKSEKGLRASPVESIKFWALPTTLSKSPFTFSCHLLPVVCRLPWGRSGLSIRYSQCLPMLRWAAAGAAQCLHVCKRSFLWDARLLRTGFIVTMSAPWHRHVLQCIPGGPCCWWRWAWMHTGSKLGKKLDAWGWGQNPKPTAP